MSYEAVTVSGNYAGRVHAVLSGAGVRDRAMCAQRPSYRTPGWKRVHDRAIDCPRCLRVPEVRLHAAAEAREGGVA